MSAEAPQAPAVEQTPVSTPVATPTPSATLDGVMDRARTSDVAAALEPTPAPTPAVEVSATPSVVPPAESPQASEAPTTPLETPVPQEAAPSAPESALAPLFDLGAPSGETFQQAAALVQNIQYDDPIAGENLLHGVYYANEAKIQNFALQRLGIPKDKVSEFVTWAKSGVPLPQPATPAPFPELVRDAAGRLVADESGQQLITLPSGRTVDVMDELGAEAYDSAKYRHGAEIADQQRQADTRIAEAQQREQQVAAFQEFQQDCFYSTQSAYLDDMQTLVTELVTPAIANLSEDDKAFGEDFQAGILASVVGGKEVGEIGKKANAHLEAVIQDTITRGQLAGLSPDQIKQACNDRLKEGRMVNFAQQQKAIIRREINARKDAFLNRMLRLNKAELKAVGIDPQVSNIPPIESVAPPPRGQGPRSLDSLLSEAGEHDRRAAQAR